MPENTLKKSEPGFDEVSVLDSGTLDYYHALLDSAPDAIIVTNASGEVLEMNEEVTRLFGYSRRDLLGQDFDILIPERFRAAHKGYHENYRKYPRSREMGSGKELYGVHKDGREISVEISLSPYQDAGEMLTIATVRDVTERKQHERVRRFADESFRRWLQDAPILAVMLDRDHRVTFCNDYICWLTGWTQEELSGKDWFEKVVPAESREDVRRLVADGICKGELQVTSENELIDKRGGKHLISWHRSLLRNAEGEITGVTGLGVDITERSLRERHQSMLLHELEHRVKNTMTLVNSITRLSLANATDFQVFKDTFMGRIRALGSVHQLLTQANWHQVDFMDMVDKALAPFDSKGVQIFINGDYGLMIPARLAQSLYLVLHELATNAIKYGSLSCDEGKVHITWDPPDDGIPQLRFQWQESSGPPVEKPQETGFGTKLIEQVLAYDSEARADLDFAREGLRASFCIPLSP